MQFCGKWEERLVFHQIDSIPYHVLEPIYRKTDPIMTNHGIPSLHKNLPRD